ncbi:hypothetical protein [Salirhabdus salicampi]|uniref:hypothetical protein n=1 Tax=Salirhabdus salicampi TaxID=476102 RepID=UPI0020C2D591|nr:hypothetical protein [Salirhabdus salicampi]MCP8616172.1 hypothetical protein [Salirhabdus salicampi]
MVWFFAFIVAVLLISWIIDIKKKKYQNVNDHISSPVVAKSKPSDSSNQTNMDFDE